MDNINRLREHLKSLLEKGLSYRDIGEVYKDVNPGTIHTIVHDPEYEPQKKEIRDKLGLPDISSVRCVSGPVAAGSQTQESRYCIICGEPFTPNTAKRKKCYDCSPVRLNPNWRVNAELRKYEAQL